MTNEPMLMLDNMKLWKDILDKDEDKICNGMTDTERKAYNLGVQNLYDLFLQKNYGLRAVLKTVFSSYKKRESYFRSHF